jgi:hypothetical protein
VRGELSVQHLELLLHGSFVILIILVLLTILVGSGGGLTLGILL